ncbi:MAG: winged helix-turn-helix transcriptional regulator [Polyangiaceae bacterium]|nr:winged helix-turn-helix transcriptional regulator [Polyangiaceae bacterium]
MSKQGDLAETYPLGPELGFLQRLWQLDHALERASTRMERTLGVTAQQRLVLLCVGRFPGLMAGQLAALLHVDPGTVSASLGRLEGRGLLERQRDPRDQRRVTLGLTPGGRALVRPSDVTIEHAVARLLGEVPEAEVATMLGVIARFVALLDGPRAEDDAPPRGEADHSGTKA